MQNKYEKTEFLFNKIKSLLSIINELEEQYPERKFSLDGHLFGSIGEVFAESYYDLKLLSQSEKTHDAVTKDGKQVQIKITQIDSVDIQEQPNWLIVLFLNKKELKIYEVYNGPGRYALKNAKTTKSGYYNRSLKVLYKINAEISENKRICEFADFKLDKWNPDIKN